MRTDQRKADGDRVTVAFAIAERAAAFAVQCQTDGTARRTCRNIEQRRLALVDPHVQFDPVGRNRIDDVARARDLPQSILDLCRQNLQFVQIGANHAELDGRIERRAVLEKHQLYPCPGYRVELCTQTFDHPQAFASLPLVHHRKHFAHACKLCRIEHIVKHRRITPTDIFCANFDRWLFCQNCRNLRHNPPGLVQISTLFCIHSHPEIGRIGVGKETETQNRDDNKSPDSDGQCTPNGPSRRTQATVEQWFIEAVDIVHDPLQ